MDPKAGRDRRHTDRVPCRGEIEFWIGSAQFSGCFTDISTQGICIETPSPAEPGTHCKIRLTLPGHPESIVAEGVVVWRNVPMGMGVKFVSLAPEAQAAIKDLTAGAPSP